jgi:hypothetical protein
LNGHTKGVNYSFLCDNKAGKQKIRLYLTGKPDLLSSSILSQVQISTAVTSLAILFSRNRYTPVTHVLPMSANNF